MEKPGVGKPKPSLQPHRLHEYAWWYEDERGIDVLQQAVRASDKVYLSTETVRIPWSRLIAAAKRCGAIK